MWSRLHARGRSQTLSSGFLALEGLISVFLLVSGTAALAGIAWICMQQEYATHMRMHAVQRVRTVLHEYSATGKVPHHSLYAYDNRIALKVEARKEILRTIECAWIVVTATWHDLLGSQCTYSVSGVALL